LAGGHERESPKDELTFQRNTQQKEQSGLHKEAASDSPPFSLVEEKILNQLNFTPSGEDPAFWPIYILQYISYMISITG
jgi:hypothetical protein